MRFSSFKLMRSGETEREEDEEEGEERYGAHVPSFFSLVPPS